MERQNGIDLGLASTYIVGLSADVLKPKHLLIASFLVVSYDNDAEMTAFLNHVRDKFKLLLTAKNGKYKSSAFTQQVKELTYTAYAPDKLIPIFEPLKTHKTLFELYGDKCSHITEDRAVDVIDNKTFPRPYLDVVLHPNQRKYAQNHRELYGKLLLRVSAPFYGLLKSHANKFDFENCLNACKVFREDNGK